MLSLRVSIVFSVGFISAVSCLHAEQSADYKAAFTCFKTGHDADTHSLEVQGIEATSEEMIASGCKFGKAFARCISQLDRSVFSSSVPNIAHYLIALEWQQMVLANKANLCTYKLPVDKLKEITIASGILTKEHLPSVENDNYTQCVGDALKKCLVSASARYEHHLDENYLTALERYFKCFEEEAANACNTPMLRHFVAIIKLHKKYFEKNTKFEEKVEKIPA